MDENYMMELHIKLSNMKKERKDVLTISSENVKQ
jgi:hypothetical protein